MAKKHRKLFPSETTSNQTQDCYGFCDPACPYNCYSTPDYYLSPPPPLNSHSDQVNHVSSYLIILVCFFIIIFVVIGFYVVKMKCYADWCGWRVNDSVYVPTDSDNSEEFNQVDHPVWLITTVGLQQSVINSITVCKYRKNEGLIEGTECSVCLNEFREDETLRLLPKCNHAFHIPCIDPWLRSHTNCPLCRAGIVSNTVAPEPAVSNLGSTVRENTNLGRNQETLLENSRNDGGVSSNLVINEESENRGGTGEPSVALEISDESNSKERVLNYEIQTEIDLEEQENTNLVRNQETLLENFQNDVGLSSNLVINDEFENRAGTGEPSEALEFNDESNSKERELNEEIQTEIDSSEQKFINLGRNQETLLENSWKDGGLSSSLVVNGKFENRGETGEQNEALEFIDESNFKKRVFNDEIQTEMGCISSDLKLACGSVLGLVQENSDLRLRRSSIEECLHMNPICMKRSFSCNGRIVSTRGYMSLKSKLNSSLLEFSVY